MVSLSPHSFAKWTDNGADTVCVMHFTVPGVDVRKYAPSACLKRQRRERLEEDDEETIADHSELRSLMLFAIVGSEDEVVIDGHGAMFDAHLTDFKKITDDFLYEKYRTERPIGGVDGGASGHGADCSRVIPVPKPVCSAPILPHASWGPIRRIQLRAQSFDFSYRVRADY
ncbi:hypothetical protein V8E36_008722 [Tilletia maclaganii]